MSEFWNNFLTICGLIISIIGTIVSLIGLKISLSSMKTAQDISDAINKTKEEYENKHRFVNFKQEIDGIIGKLDIYLTDMDLEKVKVILPRISVNCERIQNDLTESCLKKVKSLNKLGYSQKNKNGDIVELDRAQIDHSAKELLAEIIELLRVIKNEM